MQQVYLLLLHLSTLNEGLDVASRLRIGRRAEVLVQQKVEEQRRLLEKLLRIKGIWGSLGLVEGWLLGVWVQWLLLLLILVLN